MLLNLNESFKIFYHKFTEIATVRKGLILTFFTFVVKYAHMYFKGGKFMNLNSKRLRDEAKFQVFAHLSKGMLAYVLSGLITTLIVYNIQITATTKNVSLIPDTLEKALIIYSVLFLAALANLPLTFCAERFYLLISRHTPLESIPLKSFFEPFEKPSLFLKGSLLILLVSVMNVLGVFVLVVPVYLAFGLSVFHLSDAPEISVFEAMKRSAKTMKGKKMFAFKTLLPLWFTKALVSYFLSSLYFISFFVTSVIEIMIFVVLAMIYDKSRQE